MYDCAFLRAYVELPEFGAFTQSPVKTEVEKAPPNKKL